MTSTTDPTLLLDPRADAPPATFGEGQSIQGDIRAGRIEVISTADDKVNVAEPSTPTHSVYPNNHVYQSASGHLQEFDDTPGAERINTQHKAGTFREIHPDGSVVHKIFGKDFYLILDDHTLFVGGNLNISVQGNANLLVAGDLKTKVAGDVETTIHGNLTTRVTGTTTHYGVGDINIQGSGNVNTHAAGSTQINSGGTMEISGSSTNVIGSTVSVSATELDLRSTTTNNWANVYHSNSGGSSSAGTDPGAKTAASVASLDPGPGLEVPDSIIQPSVESQMALRSDNVAMLQTVDSTVTYPKDRKKFNDVADSDDDSNDSNG